jgi:FAD/FMN-containing dehydrogenase
MVVDAAGPADVRAAVVAAREYCLPFAVQATGHGTFVPADGGVLLKTAGMASVLVDPDRAIARVGPGARWSQVIAAAAPFGLVPLSGSAPSVGVTGFTLGGGVGWLSRKYGFAADSVVRAEVVTADGRLLTASADRHSDLFWALRGGGANFGVVTALEFRLYPVTHVYGGISYFVAERAAEAIQRYYTWAADAPNELSTAVLLTRVPDSPEIPEKLRGRRTLAIKALYAGEAGDAERHLAPLRAVAGPALVDGYRSMTYSQAAMGGTPARYLDLLDELPDALVGLIVGAAAADDSPVSTVEIRHWGGAMGRPAENAGATGHRAAPFSLIIDGAPPRLTEALRATGTGRSFLNFLSDPARTETAYTAENHRLLREVKRAYDPDNFFRVNHNIPPAGSRAIEPVVG